MPENLRAPGLLKFAQSDRLNTACVQDRSSCNVRGRGPKAATSRDARGSPPMTARSNQPPQRASLERPLSSVQLPFERRRVIGGERRFMAEGSPTAKLFHHARICVITRIADARRRMVTRTLVD
jgi:hypothetical protein